ncbi:MAG: hypothetical protein L0216_04370 [Planctomycetales bacterium]|nr:hypothetical protein [Planctomycetales bacterium]
MRRQREPEPARVGLDWLADLCRLAFLFMFMAFVASLAPSGCCAHDCCGRVKSPPPPLPGRSGAADTSFGWFGAFVLDPSPRADLAAALASDGASLYLAGSDEGPGAGDSQWRLEKRTASDGIKADGFGAGGVVTSNPSGGADSVTALAFDAGPSSVVLVGYDSVPGNRQWRIEKRRTTDGTLDPSFGTGGVVTVNPSAGPDEPAAVLHDSGDLYIVGTDESPGTGDTQWRIEKRTAATGALVAGFGTGGVYTSNPSSGADGARAAVADGSPGTFLLVAGFDTAPGDREWRIEKVRMSNGTLDASFGTSGAATANPSAGADEATSMALAGTALYVAGHDESAGAGDFQWRIEVRQAVSGGLDAGFGTGGVVTSNPSAGADLATAIATDGFHLLVAGADASPGTAGDRQWRVESRYPTGTLASYFGAGGFLAANPTAGDDTVSSLILAGARFYLLGTENSPARARWRIEARN